MTLQPSAATPLSLGQIFSAAWASVRSDELAKFEKSLALSLGMQDGLALSSLMRNTFAAVDAAKRRCRPGATIILPRYSCPSFIHGIQAAGMPHRYCDTDAETLGVRCEDLLRAADDSVGAVLIPNLFGLSADMTAIAALCLQRNWLLLEGADYSLGGKFGNQPLGSFGDYSILNFQEGKALPIGGGMALSRATNAFTHLHSKSAASSFVSFARAIAYSLLIRPWSYGLFTATIARLGVAKKKFSMEDTIRETRREYDYSVAAPRLGERISGFQGALGCNLLKRIADHVTIRQAHAAVLEHALRDVPNLTLVQRHPKLDSCHYIRYPVLVGHGRRDALCRHLLQQGFEASPMYVEHGMQVDAAAYPGAARICSELLTLPCHPLMGEEDLLRLASTTRTFLNKS